MKMTFRWYGETNDTISLNYIRQIPGVQGIVWALHHSPVGEVWASSCIKKSIEKIHTAGFHGEVVESVNVHESIKLGQSERDLYIDNYIKTIKNLADYGVKVICYNFMPVFDWTRTDLFYKNKDGSTSLYYEQSKIDQIDPALFIKQISEKSSALFMPGWEPERLASIRELIQAYEGVTKEDLWSHLAYFMDAVLPVAEECGVQMAIHPDDPPWSVFGLPRIITDKESVARLLSLNTSSANKIALCTGTFGASLKNSVVDLVKIFHDHIAFMHIRNVRIFSDKNFIETSHRACDGSLDIVGVVKTLYENNYSGYVRPDHGRHIWNEQCRPGYGLYDRALGIMYLLGIWDSLHT